jgi:hypothetical protein
MNDLLARLLDRLACLLPLDLFAALRVVDHALAPADAALGQLGPLVALPLVGPLIASAYVLLVVIGGLGAVLVAFGILVGSYLVYLGAALLAAQVSDAAALVSLLGHGLGAW